MTQRKFQISTLAVVLTLALAPITHAGGNTASGQKLDSGLGKLPHYSQWAKHPKLAALAAAANHVPGEKLDSGLGQLPHYSKWADSSGKQRLDLASRK